MNAIGALGISPDLWFRNERTRTSERELSRTAYLASYRKPFPPSAQFAPGRVTELHMERIVSMQTPPSSARESIPVPRGYVIAAVACLCLIAGPIFAQSSPKNATPARIIHRSPYLIANDEVPLSRAGNYQATLALTHELFANAGIPTQLADDLGFTQRIANAQVEYQKGMILPIHEQDIVTSFNDFVGRLGLPSWADTTEPQIRKLRVRLALVIPKLFVSHDPPDAKGRRQLLSPNLSPLQAGYIAATMFYMKVFDSSYQFTPAGRAKFQAKGKDAFYAEHARRRATLLNIVHGKSDSVSVADLLPAANQLLDNLGFPRHSLPSAQGGN